MRASPTLPFMAQSKSRYAPTPGPAPDRSPWLRYLLVALVSAAAGSIGTYLVLLSKLQPPPAASSPAAAPGTGLNVPPLELTAGVPPAQADRNLGNFYYDQNDWAQAIRYYESAIRQGSDDADIRTDLGNALQFSGHPDDALAQYVTAQRLNPNHEFSLFNQGGLYLERLNQPAKAVEIWNEYLRRFPQGKNATAARQLIAQVSGRPAATTSVPPATAPAIPAPQSRAPAAADDAEVERLLRLVPPKPASGKP